MLTETEFSVSEVERRLKLIPPIAPPDDLQRIWDEMFMIDLYPENQDRFGVDMAVILKLSLEIRSHNKCLMVARSFITIKLYMYNNSRTAADRLLSEIRIWAMI